ncbi:hypothetical protein KIPB_006737 [Kipferlia bialata]|nr:hypothetical protein KIPB_006737 [Kipferlia bialata]|eukprot:g6737.t1
MDRPLAIPATVAYELPTHMSLESDIVSVQLVTVTRTSKQGRRTLARNLSLVLRVECPLLWVSDKEEPLVQSIVSALIPRHILKSGDIGLVAVTPSYQDQDLFRPHKDIRPAAPSPAAASALTTHMWQRRPLYGGRTIEPINDKGVAWFRPDPETGREREGRERACEVALWRGVVDTAVKLEIG